MLVDDSATRLDVLAARAVDLACRGNVKAMALVTDRIEGRVGMRPGEAYPASDAARAGVQQAIEDIVTAFTEAKLALANDLTAHASSGDLATPVVPVVVNDGPQRWLVRDEAEPPAVDRELSGPG